MASAPSFNDLRRFHSADNSVPYLDGFAWLREGGAGAGKLVIPFLYDWVGAFSEGLVPFKRNGERGFMDKAGNTVIKLDGDAELLSGFENGLAYVRGKHEEYYVDKNGVRVAWRELVGTR